MSNVIGYKDTEEERYAKWRSMLMLRDVIVFDTERHLKSLEKNKKIYKYILKDYTNRNEVSS